MQHRTVPGIGISCFIVCWLGLFGMWAWSFGLVDAWTALQVWFGAAVPILIIGHVLGDRKLEYDDTVLLHFAARWNSLWSAFLGMAARHRE